MQTELQRTPFSFKQALEDDTAFNENTFRFSLIMIIFDIFLYTIIGAIVTRLKSDESKFHEMQRRDLDSQTGAVIRNVTKIYGDNQNPAVSGASFVLKRDYITCLLGRNGAGKSTIM